MLESGKVMRRNNMRLEGRTALITGASRNIGREVALTFAREGADLILNTRSSSAELEEVAKECRSYEVKVMRRNFIF